MGREVWGTFSVNDHVGAWPFVSDLMLFDRLRIPIPAEKDWKEWEETQGWQPDRQKAVLKVLGERAKPMVWGDAERAKWQQRWERAKAAGVATQAAAFQYTRDQLIDSLPRGVTGVQSVACYPNYESLRSDLQLEGDPGAAAPPQASTVAAVLGRTFLVPTETQRPPQDFKEELELLRRVVKLTSNRKFERRRASYWRWQRDFTDGVVTDQETVMAAVSEMDELLQEELEAVREQGIDAVARYAFLVCTVAVGLLAGPLSPITIGSAFLTVGQFVWSAARDKDVRQVEGRTLDEANVAALFHDFRKHFGMK
jgi:hypothetical protein